MTVLRVLRAPWSCMFTSTAQHVPCVAALPELYITLKTQDMSYIYISLKTAESELNKVN